LAVIWAVCSAIAIIASLRNQAAWVEERRQTEELEEERDWNEFIWNYELTDEEREAVLRGEEWPEDPPDAGRMLTPPERDSLRRETREHLELMGREEANGHPPFRKRGVPGFA
jgi:hypothetical protein